MCYTSLFNWCTVTVFLLSLHRCISGGMYSFGACIGRWIVSFSLNTLYSECLHFARVWRTAADISEHDTNEDVYRLYRGICSIPESVSSRFRRDLVAVSRAVCRRVCSKVFANHCSGFLYNRRTQSCTLSAYTGEWLLAVEDCDPRNGLEFYRRLRSSGSAMQFLKSNRIVTR